MFALFVLALVGLWLSLAVAVVALLQRLERAEERIARLESGERLLPLDPDPMSLAGSRDH